MADKGTEGNFQFVGERVQGGIFFVVVTSASGLDLPRPSGPVLMACVSRIETHRAENFVYPLLECRNFISTTIHATMSFKENVDETLKGNERIANRVTQVH